MLTDEQREDLEFAHRHLDRVMRHEEAVAIRVALAELDELRALKNAAANRTTPDATASASQSAEDAARYRWLCEDHDSREARDARDEILRRMPVMSHSAASASIDRARRESASMCEACDGHGEIVYRDQSGDPWHERSVECEACGGTGKATRGTVRAAVSPPGEPEMTAPIHSADDLLNVLRSFPDAAAQPVVATTPAGVELECSVCHGVGEGVDSCGDRFECGACGGLGRRKVSASVHARPAAADVAATMDDAAAPAPIAWMFDRRYGSGLSFVRPPDYTDEDGNLVAPVALCRCTDAALYAVAPPPRLDPDTRRRLMFLASAAVDAGIAEFVRQTGATRTGVEARNAAGVPLAAFKAALDRAAQDQEGRR